MASPPVQLNVGGTLYTTSLETLTKYPDSLLAKMCNGSMASELEYFIDRDGLMFRHILNFIRNSKLLLPENFGDEELLLEEAHFFGIARKTWDEFLNGIVVNLFFHNSNDSAAGAHDKRSGRSKTTFNYLRRCLHLHTFGTLNDFDHKILALRNLSRGPTIRNGPLFPFITSESYLWISAERRMFPQWGSDLYSPF